MAAYGQVVQNGGSEQEGLDFVQQMLENTPVQDKAASEALATFTGGKGDVLLAYENEAIRAQDAGEDVEYMIPDDTIKIETPIAVTEDASDSAQAFVDYLFSPEGQQLYADGGYRPVDPQVLEGQRGQVPDAPGPVHDRGLRRLGPGRRPISSIRRTARSPRSSATWGSPPSELSRGHPGCSAPEAGHLAEPRGRRACPAGIVVTYLSVIVLIPLAAVVARSTEDGWDTFWNAVTSPQAVAALKLTLIASLVVVVINAVAGTAIAWVLVRDKFRGKNIVNSVIDLPFALPTIVAGLTLLALYGDDSPFGINAAYTRVGVMMALLFVTLPFVVRAVQPVLMELDEDMEEAAASLGAGPLTIFRRIVLPNLTPAILAGSALGFARSIGEFGSLVLISGNIPFKTEVASVFIFGQIESGNTTGRRGGLRRPARDLARDPVRDRDVGPKEPAPCGLTHAVFGAPSRDRRRGRRRCAAATAPHARHSRDAAGASG